MCVNIILRFLSENAFDKFERLSNVNNILNEKVRRYEKPVSFEIQGPPDPSKLIIRFPIYSLCNSVCRSEQICQDGSFLSY